MFLLLKQLQSVRREAGLSRGPRRSLRTHQAVMTAARPMMGSIATFTACQPYWSSAGPAARVASAVAA